jgi:DNA repair exonuclease SbcCD ATPase subunit
MKLIELEMSNIRGIKSLKIEPRGENFVIWGPNGSGKSSVVDAIDFLLTGQISRLTGRGAGSLALEKHGPHIDCKNPDDAWVKGTFQIAGLAQEIVLRRCLNSPNELEYNEAFREQIEPILAVARRGQHVLTRRDILRFITSDAGTRAKDIQNLLDLSDIEKIRQALVTAKNKLEDESKAAAGHVETAKGRVSATVHLEKFEVDKILESVNQSRSDLGGMPLGKLNSSLLKTGIKPPVVKETEHAINLTLLEKDIQSLNRITMPDFKQQIENTETELRTVLETVNSDSRLLRNLSCFQLITLGLQLLDESGSCPLCDTPWPPEKLKEHLEEKKANAKEASDLKKRIDRASSDILGTVSNVRGSVESVLTSANELGLQEETLRLVTWLSDLDEFRAFLQAPISTEKMLFSGDQINTMFYPEKGDILLSSIYQKAKTECPETTPEQNAWDLLTRLEENLKALEEDEETSRKAQLYFSRANILHEKYLETRDAVLSGLYDKIKGRFVTLYSKLHGPDESRFGAMLKAEGPALNFEVDFYGRGSHPPHALHSEGHQDSMGLCLWLALAEYLTQGVIDLLILDDVVMSVDTEHRRDTCNLLNTEFAARQFIITTHDRTWMSQLNRGGLVKKKNIIEFYNWHLETGPQVNYQPDMWTKMEEDLTKEDVPSAAAKLRRGSEDFFRAVCDALIAPVPFKDDYRWELGHFLPSAMDQYKLLLAKTKAAAQSWGADETMEELKELDSMRAQIYARSQAEMWAINESVHYNNWVNFDVSEFRPVMEAFHDFFDMFLCPNCGGMIRLVLVDNKPANLRCSCSKMNWNLILKEK